MSRLSLTRRDHRGQPDQVGRVVTREQARRRADQVPELVLADLPGHVRELLGELIGEFDRKVEAGFEVASRTTGLVPSSEAAAALAVGLATWRLRGRRADDGRGRRPRSHPAHRRSKRGQGRGQDRRAASGSMTGAYDPSGWARNIYASPPWIPKGGTHPGKVTACGDPPSGGRSCVVGRSRGWITTEGGAAASRRTRSRSSCAPTRPDSKRCCRTVVSPTKSHASMSS